MRSCAQIVGLEALSLAPGKRKRTKETIVQWSRYLVETFAVKNEGSSSE
jgi:hypothetical protein